LLALREAIMSDHAWVLENLATYVAGGLDAEERDLVEEHTANCAECARALEEMRSVDRDLELLFADVRPSAALEDRSIQALRQAPERVRGLRLSRGGKLAFGAAAAVLLAAVGAGMSALDEQEVLQFPGTPNNAAPQMGLAFHAAKRFGDPSAGVVLLDDSLSTMGEGFDPRSPERAARQMREQALGVAQREQGLGVAQLFQDLGDQGESKSTKTTGGVLGGVRRRDPSNAAGEIPGIEQKLDDSRKTKLSVGIDSATTYFKPGNFFATPSEQDLKQIKDTNAPTPAKTDLARASTAGRSLKEADRDGEKGGKWSAEGFGRSGKRLEEEKLGEKTSSRGKGGENQLGEAKGEKKTEPAEPAASPVARRVIRSGEIEFEVDSFDAAVAVVTRLVAAARGGFIATVNSDKLPNGKVRGSVVVRMPPDRLDAFILDLRKEIAKGGELKGQRIGSQDITKQYTDMESRLRAARTMEERLLKMIKEGKGQIKDLLQAEKELGVWRTKIEELEGELRYYGNLVSLSTLTVQFTEKDIRTAAGVTESERVQTGVEVDDVEKAFREALDAVAEAKGRVTRSELKQHGAGQFNALLHFEVAPEAAGTLRDRLRQLGTVARLEIDRVQQADGGGPAPRDARIKRGPTQFNVSLYNLANVEPRETVTLKMAATDVPAAYRKLREAVDRARARVRNAQLNEQDRQNVTAQLDFDVRRADEGALQAALAAAGEALSRQVARQQANENVTDAKVLFKVELVSAATMPPRETTTLAAEVADVDAAQAVITAQAREVGGRLVQGPVRAEERTGRVTAQVGYNVPLAAAPGLVEKIKAAGRVRVRQVAPNPQAPEGKLALARIDVILSNAELLVPGDEGLWAQVRRGLSFSLRGLSLSASWLIFGVVFVLPWVVLLYLIVLVMRRLSRGRPAIAAAPAPPAASATPTGG
jgi:hypothetical protein